MVVTVSRGRKSMMCYNISLQYKSVTLNNEVRHETKVSYKNMKLGIFQNYGFSKLLYFTRNE